MQYQGFCNLITEVLLIVQKKLRFAGVIPAKRSFIILQKAATDIYSELITCRVTSGMSLSASLPISSMLICSSLSA